MKKIITLIFFIVGLGSVFGQQEVFFTQANDFYNKGDYAKAIDLYKRVLDNGQHSAELYFNLANAYYKIQEVGPSIYYYEKAVKLSPEDTDILNNYAFAKQTRIDKIEGLPNGIVKRFYKKLMNFNVDFWGISAIVASVIFVLGFVLFYMSTDPLKRKLFFGVWVLSLFVGIATLVLAFLSMSYNKEHVYGILFADEVSVQSEPNRRSEQLFKLHEGTKLQLLETIDDWSKIILVNGKSGWITSKSIKVL